MQKKLTIFYLVTEIRLVLIKKNCIEIDSNCLERLRNTKFLRIFVDEDSNWKFHVSQISLKIARNIVLNIVKYLLTHEILLILFYTMIYPELDSIEITCN